MAAEPRPSGAGPRDEVAGPTPPGAPPRTDPAPLLLDGSPEGRLLPQLIDRLGDPDLDPLQPPRRLRQRPGTPLAVSTRTRVRPPLLRRVTTHVAGQKDR